MKQALQGKLKKLIGTSVIVVCVLSVIAASCFLWTTNGNRGSKVSGLMIDLPDSLVPLTKGSTEVNAGDTVVVSIYVEKMDDVYGYQFNLHFNRDKLEYSQGLYSDIDEIQTIFAAEKDQYLLIGATKIGDQAGYSGQLVQVCHVEFIAISDFTLEPDFTMQHISVSEANIVTSDLHYLTDTEGWTVSVAVK